MTSVRTLLATAAVALVATVSAVEAEEVTLVGAVQFDENHAFTKGLRKFEELAGECSGGSLKFDLHLNSELGLEKDYFEYMSQGISVDYGVVSPSHMSTFSQMAPLMDMPFLFRDLDHWNKVLEQDALAPIAEDVLANANVRLIGYAGGGTRQLIVNHPVTNMAELEGLHARVYGISLDDVVAQKAFKEAQGLTFPLLSDPDGSVARKYQVLPAGASYTQRVTFVTDPEGTLRLIDREVGVTSHGQDMAARLRELQAK